MSTERRTPMTRVAVAQAASIPFDSAATVAKAEGLIEECATSGAELVVFPEAFIGCYPKGTAFGAVVGRRSGPGRDLYRRYFDSAVELDGPQVARLVSASAAQGDDQRSDDNEVDARGERAAPPARAIGTRNS